MTISRREALIGVAGSGTAYTMTEAAALEDGYLRRPASVIMEDPRSREATFTIVEPFDENDEEIVRTATGTRIFHHDQEIGLVKSIRYEHILPDCSSEVVMTKITLELFGMRVRVKRAKATS